MMLSLNQNFEILQQSCFQTKVHTQNVITGLWETFSLLLSIHFFFVWIMRYRFRTILFTALLYISLCLFDLFGLERFNLLKHMDM